ncbi:hypothetical protein Tco_1348019, partial [Tanacetum coccineum]
VRIEKTKRSKNDQKPTRNGKKTKSQEQDEEISQKSQPDQSNSVKDNNKGSQRPKSEVKGPLLTSLQSLRIYFEELKSKGQSCQRVEVVLLKKKERRKPQGLILQFQKLISNYKRGGQSQGPFMPTLQTFK